MRVLVIEDDVDLAANLAEYFESREVEADFAYDGPSGLRIASHGEFDVLVLDLTLPGLDGLELCRRLRSSMRRGLPILILTARDRLEDKIAGFEAGADDYVIKPFAMEELLARLVALHRRTSEDLGELLEVSDLVYDLSRSQVSRAGQAIQLHRIGEILLAALMRAAPRIVTREELEREIWGSEPPDRDLLRSHVYLLRQSIDRPFETDLLHTVRQRGYRLADLENESP